MKVAPAPLWAGLLGGGAALAVIAAPAGLLESLVMDSRLPAVLAQAEPPLGWTARALLALASGALVAAIAWLGTTMLLATRGAPRATPAFGFDEDLPMPVIRRADAHPDAPPRPPLLATRDLGTPFLEICVPAPVTQEATAEPEAASEPAAPAERPLPEDFNQPLAAFDPAAIPEVPLPPPVLPSPRRAPTPPALISGERFEVFELTPPVRRRSPERSRSRIDALARPQTEATVHALLDRLERGVARAGLPVVKPQPRMARGAAERGLEDALATLRNLARSA